MRIATAFAAAILILVPCNGPIGNAAPNGVSRGNQGDVRKVAGPSAGGIRATAVAVKLGDEIRVDSLPVGSGFGLEVAVGSDGNAMVVWGSDATGGSDLDGQSIQARRVGGSAPLGNQFQVNTSTTGDQDTPAIAAVDGGFVIAWRSDSSAGDDTSGTSIQGKRFSSVGDPLGSEFQVNVSTDLDQSAPAVASLSEGGFFIAYGYQAPGY